MPYQRQLEQDEAMKNNYETRGTSNAGITTRSVPVRNRRAALSVTTLLCLSALAGMATAQAPEAGIMMVQSLTVPRGAVWLANNNGGGHWWVGDAGFGFCEVVPLAGANPPNQLSNCQGAAKAGGQAVVATPTGTLPGGFPSGGKFVFVPDSSSKSDNVVRFIFNPANETLSSPVTITATPVVAGNGGTNGRAVGAALAPVAGGGNPTDLYVGFIRTGDIMKISGATNASKTAFTAADLSKIGQTSDGNGLQAMVIYKNDLYLSEAGGFGLSRILDPGGVSGRPACNSTAPCGAITMSPQISTLPGGLAADATYLYVGDAPFTTNGSILRYDSSTGIIANISTAVTPSYVGSDGVTRSQYFNPYGIGLHPNGDIFVSDDWTSGLRVPVLPTLQGHLWRIPALPAPPTVTSLSLSQGGMAGGDNVIVSGTGYIPCSAAALPCSLAGNTVMFGAAVANLVSCTATQCAVTSPSSAGPGVVDVRVIVNGAASPIVPVDQFTYVANSAPGAPVVTAINPKSGVAGGGTQVTITGSNLAGGFVTFGVTPATGVTCTADGLSCTATSPAGVSGAAVDVRVTNALALTSNAVPSDVFTYLTPTASVWGWGITAPKGGMVWVPGNLGGHWWSSDHSNGFCRQDVVPGSTLHAINSSVCDNGSIGSPGQAVYDARVNPQFVNSTSGALVPAGTHFIYVPDNAVKSTAIWRLTFDPNTETLVGVPEAMIPLADVRTLKPNGMAMGPDGNLYVTDLTEMNIRKVTGPNGDPRLQTVSIVAVTGDGRGANGTVGFIGNKLYISENRAASWIDITLCPTPFGTPCATTPLPIQPGAFIAGVATDPVNHLVYAADSPGGANATIWRWSEFTGVVSVYLQGGTLPAAGTPNATVWCSTTCQRPWDPNLIPGGIGGFSFAFGLAVGPDASLYITEDPTAGNRSGRGKVWISPLVN
ncbi:MAG: hypothetical protein C5B56_07785 [Proteobacteria bacterium]|nr:MAG: hypothetical protein C5B56_07785 [Pseudomonadota bacterium]